MFECYSFTSKSLGICFIFCYIFLSRFIIPNWYLMSPNKLSRNTPISEIKNPIFKCFIKLSWDDFKFFLFISFDNFFNYWLYFNKPLCWDNRFNFCVWSFTISYSWSVRFYSNEISLCFQKLYYIISSCHKILPFKYTSHCCHFTIFSNNYIIEWEIMSFCYLKIIWIMSWSYLYCTRSKIHIYHLISNNRNFFIYDWENEFFLSFNEFFISFIFWMNGYSYISEKCFWSSRRNNQFIIRSWYKISNIIEFSLFFFINNFLIWNNRIENWVIVYHVFTSINKSSVI